MAAVKIVVKFFLQTQKIGKVPHLIFFASHSFRFTNVSGLIITGGFSNFQINVKNELFVCTFNLELEIRPLQPQFWGINIENLHKTV